MFRADPSLTGAGRTRATRVVGRAPADAAMQRATGALGPQPRFSISDRPRPADHKAGRRDQVLAPGCRRASWLQRSRDGPLAAGSRTPTPGITHPLVLRREPSLDEGRVTERQALRSVRGVSLQVDRPRHRHVLDAAPLGHRGVVEPSVLLAEDCVLDEPAERRPVARVAVRYGALLPR